jgi:hypothetical protein
MTFLLELQESVFLLTLTASTGRQSAPSRLGTGAPFACLWQLSAVSCRQSAFCLSVWISLSNLSLHRLVIHDTEQAQSTSQQRDGEIRNPKTARGISDLEIFLSPEEVPKVEKKL